MDTLKLLAGKRSYLFEQVALPELSTSHYLDVTNSQQFFTEMLKILLQKKTDKMSSEFNNIFAVINKNEWNIVSFLQAFQQIFIQNLKQKAPVITANDFYQLALLLCNDFPQAHILEIANALNDYKFKDDKLLVATEFDVERFFKAFCIKLYYLELWEDLKEAFAEYSDTKKFEPFSKLKLSKVRAFSEKRSNYREEIVFCIERIVDQNRNDLLIDPRTFESQFTVSYAAFIKSAFEDEALHYLISRNFYTYDKEVQKLENAAKILQTENSKFLDEIKSYHDAGSLRNIRATNHRLL